MSNREQREAWTLDARAAAELLGVSRWTIYRRFRAGELQGRGGAGRPLRFRPSDVERFAAREGARR